MEHGKATHYRTKEPQGVGNPGVPPYPGTQPKTVGFFKNPMTLMTAPSTEIFPRCLFRVSSNNGIMRRFGGGWLWPNYCT